MAFRDFVFPQVQSQLGLRIEDADLFGATPPAPVRPEIAEIVRDGASLALAISTEKAKSEFIIAPILLELRRSVQPRFALFFRGGMGRGPRAWPEWVLRLHPGSRPEPAHPPGALRPQSSRPRTT